MQISIVSPDLNGGVRGAGLIDTAPMDQSLEAIVKLEVTIAAPGSVTAAPDTTS